MAQPAAPGQRPVGLAHRHQVALAGGVQELALDLAAHDPERPAQAAPSRRGRERAARRLGDDAELALHGGAVEGAMADGGVPHLAREGELREVQDVDVLDEEAAELGLEVGRELGRGLERHKVVAGRVEGDQDAANFVVCLPF